MLHPGNDLLAHEAALLKIDAIKVVKQSLMRKGVAIGIVTAALRNAKRDPLGVIVVLRRRRAAEQVDARAGWKQDAKPECRLTTIGIGDGAVWQAWRRAPGRCYNEGGILGDLDLGSELIEAEPLSELCPLRLCHLEQKAISRRHYEEIEEYLSLRREQAGRDGAAWLRLVDIVGNQPLQEAPRGRAGDPHHRAVSKKRRVALTHLGLPLASRPRLI